MTEQEMRKKIEFLKRGSRRILYTDTINGGEQAHRDDLWAVSTSELDEIIQTVQAYTQGKIIDELKQYANIVENAPGESMDWLDGIFYRLDTKLTHANQSIFFDVAVNEGTAALKEAKKLFALHFQGRIQDLTRQRDGEGSDER